MSIQFTGVGIIFDLLVSLLFLSRLLKIYRKDRTNYFLRYFIGIFASFSVFLLVTFFYVPGYFFDINSLTFRLLFALGFFLLYAISAFTAAIFTAINFPKIDPKVIIWALFGWGLVSSIVIIFSQNPIALYNETSTITILIRSLFTFAPLAVAFLLTFATFISLAIKDKKNRIKNILFSSAFLFWIMGGPLHSQIESPTALFLADFFVLLGFLASFAALIKKD